MPGPDPTHWLLRLTSDEWLAAAHTELAHCEETLRRRAMRPAVTHARRAAGMAWNAVLVVAPDERSGRSYMEHVVALISDPRAPDEVRAAARALRETPAAAPELITLGKPDLRVLEEARRIVAYAAERASALTSQVH
jgi:HEPN domain-containing protein